MTKHRLSPDILPPSKRQHTSSSAHTSSSHALATSLATLYDEIVLVIFSFLSYTDLCAIQRTNHNWSRLALDNQLWKRLYLREYGRTRLRGGRGFIGRADGREVKSLPERAKVEDTTDDERDWKWMFRISCNWRNGRCSTEDLVPRIAHSHPAPASDPIVHSKQVLLLGPLVIAASSDPSLGHTIALLTPTNARHTLSCQTSRTTASTEITTLALDQSPPSSSHRARLAAFLSTGDFIIFNVDHSHPIHSSRLLTYQPALRLPRTAPILQAVYHGELLITLSESFHLSIYRLKGDTVAHAQTLSSFTSYPPSSMVLTPTSATSYKLVLAYAIPVFPAHWSVGATELIISCQPSMLVTSSRTTRAMDVSPGWIDEQKMRAMREQWSRKVERVADTQTDGKWVVLAPSEAPPSSQDVATAQRPQGTSPPPSPFRSSSLHSPSSLQLYRLHFPASTSGASNPKLTFVRTLHGQIGPVCAISLADGRCVSLGVNGSIWVWDLEAGLGAEVSSGISHAMSEAHDVATYAKATIAFDEKRIISAAPYGVELRRFDI